MRNDGEKQNDSSAAQQQDNRKKPPPVVKETVVEAETVKEDEDGDKKPAAKGSGEAKEEEKVHVSPVTMEEAIYNKERMKEALVRMFRCLNLFYCRIVAYDSLPIHQSRRHSARLDPFSNRNRRKMKLVNWTVFWNETLWSKMESLLRK